MAIDRGDGGATGGSHLTPTDGAFIVGDGSAWVVESGATARTSMGVGTTDTPQFTGVEVGHASDTTLTRSGAGDIAVENNVVYRAGGTDVPVADGGTGASTAAGARTNLGVVPGTDVQAYDATLASLAALGTAADKFAYTTGIDTWAEAAITAAGRAVLDDVDAAAQRTTLGLGTAATKDTGNAAAGNIPLNSDIQGQTLTAFTTGGTATAFTLTPTPAITANTAGIEFDITFNAAAGATPTLAVSGLTALSLKYRDSTGAKQAVTSTQVPSGWRSKVVCDGTDWVVREIPAVSALSDGDKGDITISAGVWTIDAGVVSEAKLAASAVSQGKLKTSTATYSTATSVYTVVTLSGGGYGFLPTIGADNTNATKKLCTHRNGQDVDNTDIGTSASIIAQTAQYTFGVSPSGTSTLILQERYVAACPPYNLGDGDVPLFIFALMRSDGSIHSLVVTPDPPWANNGPTSIRPDLVSPAGKEYKLVKQVVAEHGSYAAAKQALGVQAVAERLTKDRLVPIEITQAIKQADMPLIPHSFITHPIKPGETVVLVQPVGALCERMLHLHQHGESVAELFHNGHLLIGNTALALNSSPGVMPVAAKWKLTV